VDWSQEFGIWFLVFSKFVLLIPSEGGAVLTTDKRFTKGVGKKLNRNHTVKGCDARDGE